MLIENSLTMTKQDKEIAARSISSYAVLKTLFDTNKSYFDLLIPFVREAVDSPTITIITAPIVETLMLDTFGLVIPASVCESILKKMSKDRTLRPIDAGYTLQRARNGNAIFEQITEKEKSLNQLLLKLRTYTTVEFNQHWTLDETESNLQSFFDHYADSFFEIENWKSHRPSTTDSHPIESKEIFAIASFIDQCEDSELQFIHQLYTGQVIANTILCVDLFHLESSLKDLVIIIDAPICFHILGINSREKEDESLEFFRLAKKLKCSVKVFEHTIQEVQNVLLQTLNHWDSTREFQLRRYLNERNISKSQLKELHDTLREKLTEKGINIQRAPLVSRSPLFIESDVEESLKEKVKQFFETAVEYDVKSAMYMFALREFENPTRLEQAKYIFVTSNGNVARAVNDLCKEDPRFKYVALIVTDSVIGNHLWLRAPVDSKFPSIQLSAACSSLIRLSDEQWSKVVENAESLRSQGSVTSDQIAIIRSDPVFQEIASRTLMGSIDVDKSSIGLIIDRYTNQIREPMIEQISLMRKRISDSIQQKEKAIREIDDKIEETISKFVFSLSITISALALFATALPIYQSFTNQKPSWWLLIIAVFGTAIRLIDFVCLPLKPRDIKKSVPRIAERVKPFNKVRAHLHEDVIRLRAELVTAELKK